MPIVYCSMVFLLQASSSDANISLDQIREDLGRVECYSMSIFRLMVLILDGSSEYVGKMCRKPGLFLKINVKYDTVGQKNPCVSVHTCATSIDVPSCIGTIVSQVDYVPRGLGYFFFFANNIQLSFPGFCFLHFRKRNSSLNVFVTCSISHSLGH